MNKVWCFAFGGRPLPAAVVRVEAAGTPTGEFFGARPSGRSFKTMSVDI